MSTTENLQAAFAGESQANRKYLAFAKQAEKDGFPVIAKLFRAAAEAETIHAHAHLRILGDVKTTAENLQAAIDGEGHEYKEMYPDFLKAAEAEGNRGAITSFKYALGAEEVHYNLYSKALETLRQGKDIEDLPVYICQVCGDVHFGEPPDKCPICLAKKEKYVEIK